MTGLQKNDVIRAGGAFSAALRRLTFVPMVAVLCGALVLPGCAPSTGGAELPSLERDRRQLLSKAEQQKAIVDLARAKEDEIAAAQRRIEKSR